MVRNLKGGNRHKKMASKNVQDNDIKIKTRYPDPNEPCEIYASVIKLFGQGNCEVICNDNVVRLCIIRKKFKGRNKSRNFITNNTKVLVGLRDWEKTSETKREKCDLLEVYDRNQYGDIQRDKNYNSKILNQYELLTQNVSDEKSNAVIPNDELFEFIRTDKKNENEKQNENTIMESNKIDNDEIDFDAI